MPEALPELTAKQQQVWDLFDECEGKQSLIAQKMGVSPAMVGKYFRKLRDKGYLDEHNQKRIVRFELGDTAEPPDDGEKVTALSVIGLSRQYERIKKDVEYLKRRAKSDEDNRSYAKALDLSLDVTKEQKDLLYKFGSEVKDVVDNIKVSTTAEIVELVGKIVGELSDLPRFGTLLKEIWDERIGHSGEAKADDSDD